jgi:hypothetical protein
VVWGDSTTDGFSVVWGDTANLAGLIEASAADDGDYDPTIEDIIP